MNIIFKSIIKFINYLINPFLTTKITDIKIDSYSNRGASGIDGDVSTALGISAANNVCRSLLVIGDLSFYHDMN